jgi:hypothetical protein
MNRTVLLVSATLLVACSSARAPDPPDEVAQLRWVETADPLIDAKGAVERKDFTLLGVNGYTWTIPGVVEADKFAYRDKYGMKAIEGTSDVIMSAEHGRLIELATKYAKTYNEYLLSHAQ